MSNCDICSNGGVGTSALILLVCVEVWVKGDVKWSDEDVGGAKVVSFGLECAVW